jgi:hypothetical protein
MLSPAMSARRSTLAQDEFPHLGIQILKSG